MRGVEGKVRGVEGGRGKWRGREVGTRGGGGKEKLTKHKHTVKYKHNIIDSQ